MFYKFKETNSGFVCVCKEAALVILDLANKYFPCKLGDRMSPMNEYLSEITEGRVIHTSLGPDLSLH